MTLMGYISAAVVMIYVKDSCNGCNEVEINYEKEKILKINLAAKLKL